MKNEIQLSDHFSYGRLVKFVIPSVVMMVFTSIYGVIDGIFVSNFVGKTPFAAINLVFPLIMILGGFGFMLGTGGTAIVAKTFGLGDKKKANEYFSFLIIATAAVGILLAALGIAFAEPVARLLGAEGEMLGYAVSYYRIVLLALPFFMLQNSFQNFFVTAEKPKLCLTITVLAGVTNIVFDALFVAVFGFGLEGAAWATALSQTVGGLVPVIYFASENGSTLRFCRTKCHLKVLVFAAYNGFSELLSNISSSIVTVCYNAQLLSYEGEDGVAAYGVIMYISFIFISIFIGFVIGAAPIVSYHFGAGNSDELRNLRKKSTVMVFAAGATMLTLSLLLSSPLCKMFVGYDEALYSLTRRGFIINAFAFLLAGFNIFGSSYFTALNNGGASAIISFLRTLVFQVGAVFILPLLLGIDGIWFSVITAELLAAIVTESLILANKKKYNY